MSFILAADPVSSMLGGGGFKSLMTVALVVIAGLALFAPTILANIKSTVIGWVKTDVTLAGTTVVAAVPAAAPEVAAIEALLQQLLASQSAKLGAAGTPPAAITAVQSAPVVNVDDMVQSRAAALKNACPKATADLRLKWLEQGFDSARAQVDYIAILEQQLSAPAVAAIGDVKAA